MRLTRIIKLIFIFLFMLAPAAVLALEVKSGNVIMIESGQTVPGNLFAAGSKIIINGEVDGDLICAGQDIEINGQVKGSVICAGMNFSLNGSVANSVRAAGETVMLNGKIGQNAMILASIVSVGVDSAIGWDLLAAAENLEFKGSVGRGLSAAVKTAVVGGQVAENADFKIMNTEASSRLKIEDSAQVGGNLTYYDRDDAEISSVAKIGGNIEKRTKPDKPNKSLVFAWVWGRIFAVFSAIIVGLVLVGLFKESIMNITRVMKEKPLSALGYGASIIIFAPLAVFFLVLTIIGLPLALIIGSSWLVLMYIGKLFAAVCIGKSLVDKLWQAKNYSLIWPMCIGVVIISIITAIPVVGWTISALAAFWGAGGLWLLILPNFKQS